MGKEQATTNTILLGTCFQISSIWMDPIWINPIWMDFIWNIIVIILFTSLLMRKYNSLLKIILLQAMEKMRIT